MRRKHQSFTCSTTPQGHYPYQQIKVRSEPDVRITKNMVVSNIQSGSTHETLNLTGGKIL